MVRSKIRGPFSFRIISFFYHLVVNRNHGNLEMAFLRYMKNQYMSSKICKVNIQFPSARKSSTVGMFTNSYQSYIGFLRVIYLDNETNMKYNDSPHTKQGNLDHFRSTQFSCKKVGSNSLILEWWVLLNIPKDDIWIL